MSATGTTVGSSGIGGNIENQRAGNKEAILTSGLGYGKKKRHSLAAFWSIVWPGLEKNGWKRIIGEGNNEGSMLFMPPGIDSKRSGKRKNIDYYDKIISLIGRLEERRNAEEGSLLDLFRKEVRLVVGDNPESRSKEGPSRPRLKGFRQSQKVLEVDTSWKDGRSLYPKRSSCVGAEYQVSFLPRAGTFETENQVDEPKYDLIWDFKQAAEKGWLSFIEDNEVPHNKREKALQLIHENNYSVENKYDFIQQINVTNESSWTINDREKFRTEIFRSRKNFKKVCHTMENKKMGDVIAYYLGKYKKSDDYRLLKTVRIQERIEKAEQSNHEVDQCAICGEGGNLLICDGCESEWHMECTQPALKTIPEGRWECDICVDRKFLDGRKRLLHNVVSNLKSQDLAKRKKLEQPPSTDVRSDDSYETNTEELTKIDSHILEAVEAFSKNIESILFKSSVPTDPDQVQQLH
mmetsp:Transcript_22908/g.46599  ORF Transcript_22908/g.46599 Transcript_22908/m.46599 type:complete len:464 (+) Transcript_22908:127-1518(+)|eukprot:CAMPEP_0201163764 /NCGR_PEP_ID=MMETSP0851-20130426/57821_1 /ASSEMBLY_ACC=CAM_ASM_000631 /TAXON_ID=183588 /ORGANISM="Pseudo-nitzschia fraudulenta, Strain WWA7" /LENGTH=463 /DNA_ID=CAMNT_0047444001 /DNA_START=125 /DNA_END=1516 /DNA_ORIENTATION=+